MTISGIQCFTLLDFPGKLACVIFTAGCNFRCGFCHNPEFVLPERIAALSSSFIPEEAVLRFLTERRGLLDGVVISGGEPTLQPELISFMDKVKSMGFLVKLDTNGNRPEVVAEAMALGVVDYIAMDFKTSLDQYQALAGTKAGCERIKNTLELLLSGSIMYELRTTLIKEVHTREILEKMAGEMTGAKRLYLQSFRSSQTLSPGFSGFHAFSPEETADIARVFAPYVNEVCIR